MKKIGFVLASAAVIAGCATVATETDYGKAALALMKSDFRSKGPATVEGVLNQDEAQRLCSEHPTERPKEVAAKIEAEQLKQVKYPSDGKYLGSWQEGEKIAQNGRGMHPTRSAARTAAIAMHAIS
jgi:L-cysteine S-thiosulfotransferase